MPRALRISIIVVVVVLISAQVSAKVKKPGKTPAFSDSKGVISYSTKIMKQCGVASASTLPYPWKMFMVGNTGCTVYAPPTWSGKLEQHSFEVTSDDKGSAGFLVMSVQLPGVTWTLESMTSWLVEQLKKEYPDFTVMESRADAMPFGIGSAKTLSVKFTNSGIQSVGLLQVLFMKCSPILGTCPLLAMASWAPLNKLHEYGCVLSQVGATVKCPQGASSDCVDADCKASCKKQGRKSGRCVDGFCKCE